MGDGHAVGIKSCRCRVSMRRAGPCAVRTYNDDAGLTLLELMIAFALLAIILAAGMQAYLASYSGIVVQEQRTEAIQLARTVLANLREVRDRSDFEFPASFLARYPDGADVTDVTSTEGGALAGTESIRVEYGDTEANPLFVRVVVTWRDPRNRELYVDMTTLLTDR